jgi:hypothetical protein
LALHRRHSGRACHADAETPQRATLEADRKAPTSFSVPSLFIFSLLLTPAKSYWIQLDRYPPWPLRRRASSPEAPRPQPETRTSNLMAFTNSLIHNFSFYLLTPGRTKAVQPIILFFRTFLNRRMEFPLSPDSSSLVRDGSSRAVGPKDDSPGQSDSGSAALGMHPTK